MTRECSVEDCADERLTKGLCSKHYSRKIRHGDPMHERETGRTWVNSNGYVNGFRPGHPVADKQGRVYVHRAVLYDAIGPGVHPCHWCHRDLIWGKGLCKSNIYADHINSVRTDNRPENLVPSCHACNVTRTRPNLKRRRETWEGK